MGKGFKQNACLYKPLPILTRPWEDLSLDFVVELPRKQPNFDSILVMVYRFSKMAHFIPFKKASYTSYVANLFPKEVVQLHRLPTSIVSHHDVKFVSYFWKTLWTKLGIQLKISSLFYPHGVDQIEVVNCNLSNLLRCLVKD